MFREPCTLAPSRSIASLSHHSVRLGILDWLAGLMLERREERIRAETKQPGEIDASLAIAEGLAPLGPAHDHIDAPRAALSAD